MLVVAARRIWTERRHANAVFHFNRSRHPFFGRPVGFRRHPSLDVPPVDRNIFWLLAHLDRFADHVAVRVAVRPASANPRKTRATPHNAEIRLAKTVPSPCASDALAHMRRRLMRFS